MNPIDYQHAAARTECNQRYALDRMSASGYPNLLPIRLNHAVLGLAGEVGELAGAVEKFVYYGRPLDQVNIEEELGDCLWYIALACNTLGLDLGKIMEANIRKLRARYPEKYIDGGAPERNVAAEREAITATMEPCCECGQDYPRADLLAGYVFCSACREKGFQTSRVQDGHGFGHPPDAPV